MTVFEPLPLFQHILVSYRQNLTVVSAFGTPTQWLVESQRQFLHVQFIFKVIMCSVSVLVNPWQLKCFTFLQNLGRFLHMRLLQSSHLFCEDFTFVSFYHMLLGYFWVSELLVCLNSINWKKSKANFINWLRFNMIKIK